MSTSRRSSLVPLTLVLAVILVGVTAYGLLSADPYRLGDDMNAQGRGQDLLTLVATPVLIWAAVRACRGSLRAHLLWLGLMLYLIYSYISYAFGVPFNDAFLGYVAILGISSYLLFTGLMRVDVRVVAAALTRAPRRATAWVFATVGVAFAFVWLSDIVRALPGGLPKMRFAYDMPSPIHVLDLAWIIPLLVGTAVLLLRSRPAGYLLAAVLVAKVFTLGSALLAMAGFQIADGSLAADDAPVVVLAVAVVASSSVLLVTGARRMLPPAGPWLRPTVWPTVDERAEEPVPAA
jgi:hypothetical protein